MRLTFCGFWVKHLKYSIGCHEDDSLLMISDCKFCVCNCAEESDKLVFKTSDSPFSLRFTLLYHVSRLFYLLSFIYLWLVVTCWVCRWLLSSYLFNLWKLFSVVHQWINWMEKKVKVTCWWIWSLKTNRGRDNSPGGLSEDYYPSRFSLCEKFLFRFPPFAPSFLPFFSHFLDLFSLFFFPSLTVSGSDFLSLPSPPSPLAPFTPSLLPLPLCVVGGGLSYFMLLLWSLLKTLTSGTACKRFQTGQHTHTHT